MVIAMVAMGMVQVPSYKVIDMIAMRHGLVTTVRPMTMRRIVAGTVMSRCASVGIGSIHWQAVFFNTRCRHMVQMTVVQKIDMIAMLDSGVAAACAVLMGMVRARHDQPPSSSMGAGPATNSAACSSAVMTKSATCRSANA
jgi:hypothetical protein